MLLEVSLAFCESQLVSCLLASRKIGSSLRLFFAGPLPSLVDATPLVSDQCVAGSLLIKNREYASESARELLHLKLLPRRPVAR
jgi:hypothetical protein